RSGAPKERGGCGTTGVAAAAGVGGGGNVPPRSIRKFGSQNKVARTWAVRATSLTTAGPIAGRVSFGAAGRLPAQPPPGKEDRRQDRVSEQPRHPRPNPNPLKAEHIAPPLP